MVALLEELEKKARELPVYERERLANNIMHSIVDQKLSPLESEWLDLAEKRFEALVSGQDKGITESDFFHHFGLRT